MITAEELLKAMTTLKKFRKHGSQYGFYEAADHLLSKLDEYEESFKEYEFLKKNPLIAVDICVSQPAKKNILLIERKNPPYGWALPGGFVDRGETLFQAAQRELIEETGLQLWGHQANHFIQDNPDRDPRQHVISVVFWGIGEGELLAGDDAKNAQFFPLSDLPELVFDHKVIIAKYRHRAGIKVK